MTYILANTFAELYFKALKKVYSEPDFITSPRGQKIRECTNVLMEIKNPYSNLFKCQDKTATLFTKYLKKEICLYLSATDKLAEFSKASAFWKNIANPDGETINSAYGNLIFNPNLTDGRSQFDWAFDCLKKDKDSRQSFMRFNNTSHQFEGVLDLPCTFYALFHIRNNKLNMTISMRSNDIILGLAYDVPSFTMFQHLMLLRLREVYPDLQMGTYSHISHSLHIYDRDTEIVEKRLANGLTENSFPMPNDWHVIKSNDIAKLKEIRFDGQLQLFNDYELAENKDFYDWILS